MTTFTDGYLGDVSTYCDTFTNTGAADTNYGANSTIYLHQLTVFGLIKFDLSSIPDGSTINSATLYLYEYNDGVSRPYTVTIHRIKAANSSWTEDGATGNHQVGTTDWAGGHSACGTSATDYEATEIGHFHGDRVNAQGFEYVIALDAAQIKTMLTTDYGLVLVNTDSDADEGVISSDSAGEVYRPKLVVEYTEGGCVTVITSTATVVAEC